MSASTSRALDPRMLLVESDEIFAYELISELSMSDEAVEVDVVVNVRKAAAIAENDGHDIIVVDLQSASTRTAGPALRRLRQTTRASLIVVSNLPAHAEAAGALAAGADAFVVKSTEGAEGVVRAVRVALERRAASDRLLRLAFRDPLTGLDNRARFYASVDEAIGEAGPHGRLAVLFVDLDGFKGINDTYGHWVGDEVLRELGRRLRERFRSPTVTIGRLGGDEFALLVDRIGRLDDALEVAETVVETLAAPMVVAGVVHEVGCRCGIAMRPTSGLTTSELIRGADDAMYAAKKGGGSIRVHVSHDTAQASSSNQPWAVPVFQP